jgi:hypothetical protein
LLRHRDHREARSEIIGNEKEKGKEKVELGCRCGKMMEIELVLGLFGSQRCSCGRYWIVECIFPEEDDVLRRYIEARERGKGNNGLTKDRSL